MSTQYEFTASPDGALPFRTTVLPNGTLADPVPEELYGAGVLVIPVEKKPALPKDDDFWRKKTLAEIDAEQGGPKVCTDPDKLSRDFPKLWDTPEELEEFLQRRKDEI